MQTMRCRAQVQPDLQLKTEYDGVGRFCPLRTFQIRGDVVLLKVAIKKYRITRPDNVLPHL